MSTQPPTAPKRHYGLTKTIASVLCVGFLLAACTGGGDGSSSSESVSSSPVLTSSVATSSVASCTVDTDNGASIYTAAGASCQFCHGETDGSNQTLGATGGGKITIVQGTYGVDNGPESSLDEYIEKHMASFLGDGCAANAAGCADDVAAYLYDSANKNWCDQDPITSQPTVSSTSAQASSASSVHIPPPPVLEPYIVKAINVGGAQFTADNGTEYTADELSTGGDISNQPTFEIANTTNPTIYQSERWGEFSYELPVANGEYTIMFQFAEFVWTETGKRIFDVKIEETTRITALDLVDRSGAIKTAFDKTINKVFVSDGKLNINFVKQTHNATVSGIVVTKIPDGRDIYHQQCEGCHGNTEGEQAVSGGALIQSECSACDSLNGLASFIDLTMPSEKAVWCKGQCSIDVAKYILENHAGFNGNPESEKADQVPTGGDLEACEQGVDVSFGGLRRITRGEYGNLIQDLFNDNRDFTTSFGRDGKLGNFNINVELPISELGTEQYIEVGEQVATQAANNLASWAPCTGQNDNCVRQILDTVVKRAYRREMTTAEKDRLFAVYSNAKNDADFKTGLATLLEAVLSSPNFLYVFEFGTGNAQPSGAIALSAYEMAARLSLFLWRSVPDEILLAEADNNRLSTKAQVLAQAKRMLSDPRAKNAVALFHKEWMKLEDPKIGDEHEAIMRAGIEDTVRTVTELVYTDDGAVADLFSVAYGYLNAETKGLYGVSGSAVEVGEGGFDKYALNPSQRAGLLSRAGFLTFNSPPSGRGKFIREEVLCGVIPPPPADVIPEVPEGDPDEPPRNRWLEHVVNPACGGCHQLMDPLGFAFDNFDEEGLWRDMIGKWNVDATGEVVETTDINGTFDGGMELQGLLAGSVDTQECYTLQWFRFATGRQPGLEDSCALAQANQMAKGKDYNIREVMLSVTQTDAFRYRRAEPKSE